MNSLDIHVILLNECILCQGFQIMTHYIFPAQTV